MAEKPDLSKLALERVLRFLEFQLQDQDRFNDWILRVMTQKPDNPAALTLLNLLLNKVMPTPQSVKVGGDDGFRLTVRHVTDGAPGATADDGAFSVKVQPRSVQQGGSDE